MANDANVPVGRLSRLARMAGAGARTAAGLLRGEGARAIAVEQAARTLGELRGLAAKAGQMASYIDGFVPEKHQALFEATFRSLQLAAATSSPAEIRAVVEAELGAPVSDLFVDWDDRPLASASIGQVHRATVAGGTRVAVKVQHPGIDRAVEQDLQNAGTLSSVVAAIGPPADVKGAFEELRARFREELDYRIEASHQARFAALHVGDAAIRVPRVIGERSSRRVLTTELVQGLSIEQAAAAAEPTRRRHVETLWRFVFKSILCGGLFNADPHPGNYLFGEDGSVTFLDFGCVQTLSPVHVDLARQMHRAARRRDEPALFEATRKMLRTRGGDYERVALDYSRRCFEPLFGSPFRIDRAYVRGVVNAIGEMKPLILRKSARFVPLPREMLLMNRLQFGFYSVLARFDVEADYAAVERAFLGDS